ncbi:MAG TPA: ATP-binding protein [Allosphingosinicella sp.]|nr:ATP-binding protein [Allosphingosinicella sp.]
MTAAQFDLFASAPRFSQARPAPGFAAAAGAPPSPPAAAPPRPGPPAPPEPPAPFDFAAIAGQDCAKRVLEIALAGGHNVLFRSPHHPMAMLIELCEATEALADALGFPADMRPTIFHSSADSPTGTADLNLDLAPTSPADLQRPPPCETSAEIAARVRAAREAIDHWPDGLDLDPLAARLLDQAAAAMGLDPARRAAAADVALTIAALAQADHGDVTRILRVHIAEALAYARLPRVGAA